MFALYANLALAGRTWLERGRIAPEIGLWWVHGLFLIACVAALALPKLRRNWRARHHAVTPGASGPAAS
jgi:lipopolysaccharide export system permease protein